MSFRSNCAEKLLTIANIVYHYERWQKQLENNPEYEYPREDQESKDIDRPVYVVLSPHDISSIQQAVQESPDVNDSLAQVLTPPNMDGD